MMESTHTLALRHAAQFGLIGLLAMCLSGTAPAQAGLRVTYVKTLGQANPDGIPLKGAGIRQVLPDAEGNLYLAVVNGVPWTSLQKITPEGRVLWETTFAANATTPLVLVDGQLYAIAITGYGAWFRRCDAATGKIDPTWGWAPDHPAPAGMRKVNSTAAMVAVGPYLYIADNAGHEIRRFDRATADERPFATRLMVVDPLDLAVTPRGTLLILTADSVLETDQDGKPVRVPLIDELVGAQAMEVDQTTGAIYVAQGGQPDALLNRIWQYTADGKATGVKLGRGGDFNGLWTPTTFAFSAGAADFSLDVHGGIWVNTGLGQLVHFTTPPTCKNDRVLLTTDASSIAVDDHLNVYLGLGQGGMKLSWDNQVLWTSGIRPTGDAKRYPSSPVNGWPVYLADAGGKNPLFHLLHDGHAYTLLAETGELAGAVYGSGQDGNFANRITVAGGACYLGYGEKQQGKVTQGTSEKLADWRNWKAFYTPPAGAKVSLLGVSPDTRRVYLHDGKQVICTDLTGTVLWQQPSAVFPGIYVIPFAMLDNRVVFLAGANGKLVARDALTGEQLAIIGETAVDGRPAISGFSGLAVATKERKTYLFVATSWQVQVFEIAQ